MTYLNGVKESIITFFVLSQIKNDGNFKEPFILSRFVYN